MYVYVLKEQIKKQKGKHVSQYLLVEPSIVPGLVPLDRMHELGEKGPQGSEFL